MQSYTLFLGVASIVEVFLDSVEVGTVQKLGTQKVVKLVLLSSGQ